MADPLRYYPSSASRSDYPLLLGCRMVTLGDNAQLQLSVLEPVEPDLFDGVIREPAAPPYMRFYGAIWPDFRDRLIRAWSGIDGNVARSLENWGMTISLYDQMSDFCADFVTGYPDQPGLFSRSSKRIVMSQRSKFATGCTVPAVDLRRTLYHETGHAIDECFGKLYRQPGFEKAYTLDANAIDDDQTRWQLSYFLTSDNATAEAFAEGWTELSTCVNPSYTTNLFRKSFPRVLEWIASNVPSADHGFTLPDEALTKRDLAGSTPLQILWRHLDVKELKQLLMRGANPLARTTYLDYTILEQALKENRIDLVKPMLDHILDNPGLATSETMAARLSRLHQLNTVVREDPMIVDAFARIEAMISERGIGPDTDGIEAPPSRDIIWNLPRKKKAAQ
jgi:hypothetical protein